MLDALINIYGFKAPYKFDRAIAFLLAVIGVFVVGAIGMHALMQQEPLAWNISAQFYAYLIGLFLVAALVAFKPKLAYVILTVALFEVSLSLGLSGFAKLTGLPVADLRPYSENARRFDFHPLLRGVPKPSFTLYHQGLPVLKHDADGRREVTLSESFTGDNVPSINVYGGSTTYDVGVVNGATWVDYLQRDFGTKVRVYNYGVQGYSTVENIIQTAFYARHGDRHPVCSVYYLGWNDIRNLHIPNLDPGYADFHLRAQIGNLSLRNIRPSVSPLFNMLVALILSNYEIEQTPPDYTPDTWNTDGIDENLERIFTENLKTIIAINKSQGSKVFFIGQLFNKEKLTSSGVYGWLPKVRDKDVWNVGLRYNSLMKAVADKYGAVYIDVPIRKFTGADFIDQGHFSPDGARKFSTFVATGLEDCAKQSSP